jgi:hypothetical protein
VTNRHRSAAKPRVRAALAVLAGVGVLVAGCGGGSSPGIASVSSSTSSSQSSPSCAGGGGGPSAAVSGGPSSLSGGGGKSIQFTMKVNRSPAQLVKFAACMRANGEPNFPDPSAGGTFSGSSSQGLDINSRQFQIANYKCKEYTPHAAPDRRRVAAVTRE